MLQLLPCWWANLDHSAWPYRAQMRVCSAPPPCSAMCRKRDALPNLRWSCLRAARTSARGGESTLSPTPDWSLIRWDTWHFNSHCRGTAKVAPVFNTFFFFFLISLNWIYDSNDKTTGGRFKSWIIRWVVTQEDKTQSSSASHNLECFWPRNCSREREFTRFVCS